VTREVTFEDQALSQTAAFLHDDPDGVRSIFEAVDRLPNDPAPAQSFSFGTAGLRRLHLGRYRILYPGHRRRDPSRPHRTPPSQLRHLPRRS